MAVKKIKSGKRAKELDEEGEGEPEEQGEEFNEKFAKNKLLKEKFENSRAKTNYSNFSNEELGNVEEEIKKLEGLIKEDGEEIKKVEINASKPISGLKKGDKIKVDGKELEIDAHYTLIDHGKTKEMTIELFDPKTDKDYQLRYFSDQVETSMEFYELEEILYVKKLASKIEW